MFVVLIAAFSRYIIHKMSKMKNGSYNNFSHIISENEQNLPFFLLDENPPFQLQPDSPAVAYQLSYNQFKMNQSRKNLQSTHEAQLMKEIDKLSEYIRDKQNYIRNQEQKYLRSILMLKTQIQRLLCIIRDYDSSYRKQSQESKSLENMYILKLQQLKCQLRRQFQTELLKQKQQTKQQILLIKDTYFQKINMIKAQQKSKQDQLQHRKFEIDDKICKISIFQLEKAQQQYRIKVLNEKIYELQNKLGQAQWKIRDLQSDFHNIQKDSESTLVSLTQRNKMLTENNQQLVRKIDEMADTINTFGNKKSSVQEMLRNKDQQCQTLQLKYQKVKLQIEELRKEWSQLTNVNIALKGQAVEYEKEINKLAQEIKRSQDRQRNSKQRIKQLQKQIQSFKLRKTQENKQQIKQLNQVNHQKIEQMRRQIGEKNFQIEQINREIQNRGQIYKGKLIKMQNMMDSLTQQWKGRQKQLKQANALIKNRYLKEIEQAKKTIQKKEQDMIVQQQMIENILKSKAASVTPPKKNK